MMNFLRSGVMNLFSGIDLTLGEIGQIALLASARFLRHEPRHDGTQISRMP